jgi:hypothetical protein
VSSWLATQLSESPSGRRQPEHRNTSGLSSAASSSRGACSAPASDASRLVEFHVLVHFCSSWCRLESSDSRLPNSEESLHLLLRSHTQEVEEHPLQQTGDQAPAITYKSPAPARGRAKCLLRMRGAGEGGAAGEGPRPEGRGLRKNGCPT